MIIPPKNATTNLGFINPRGFNQSKGLHIWSSWPDGLLALSKGTCSLEIEEFRLHPRSLTASLPLKNDGCKTILSFWEDPFSGAMLDFRGLILLFLLIRCLYIPHHSHQKLRLEQGHTISTIIYEFSSIFHPPKNQLN